MKQVKFKCRKCGYLQIIPDKTESLLCGNCGTWNRPQSLFAKIEQAETEKEEKGLTLRKDRGNIPGEIPDAFPDEHKDLSETVNKKPSNPGLMGLIMILFVIAPVISIVADRFELPPATTMLLLGAVIILYMLIKKRS